MPDHDTSSDLLTRDQCQKILRKVFADQKPETEPCSPELLHFEVKPALDAIGYLGEYYRLTLHYAAVPGTTTVGEKSIKLFVKTLPVRYAEPQKEAIFRKETHLYASLLHQMQRLLPQKWCAKVFFIRDDLFVMEDLTELGLQISTNACFSFTPPQMEQLLSSLAALHATSIAHEVKTHQNIGLHYQEMLYEVTVAPTVDWYTTGLEALIAVIKQHAKYQAPELQDFIARQLPQRLGTIYDMVQPSMKYRNVLCHRDPWCGNIFFLKPATPEDRKCANSAVLVDYQTCRYCPATIDLILAIFLNLDKRQRQLGELSYVHWYYQKFMEFLLYLKVEVDESMALENLLDSYEEFQLFGCVYRTIAMTIILAPKSMVTNEYKYVDRREPLMKYMQENDTFRSQMEECIEEIMERVLKS